MHKLTLSDPRVLSGISFGILSGICVNLAIWHNFWQFKATMPSGISFGILSGIRHYCVFSHSLWHSISPRRLWSRSGGHHSDPGFAVEVRRGEEDKKEERSGWHRISQPGTCRWRKDTNKAKEAHGITIQADSPCPLWRFIQSKGMVTRYEVPKLQKMRELKSS